MPVNFILERSTGWRIHSYEPSRFRTVEKPPIHYTLIQTVVKPCRKAPKEEPRFSSKACASHSVTLAKFLSYEEMSLDFHWPLRSYSLLSSFFSSVFTCFNSTRPTQKPSICAFSLLIHVMKRTFRCFLYNPFGLQEWCWVHCFCCVF